MDPEPFNMAFYDSLGVFKPIFSDFDFFGFLCTQRRPSNAAQSLRPSKIVKKHQKYVKIRVFCIKMLETGVKKCSKHNFPLPRSFFEFPNRFPIGFRQEKVYKLDFGI